MRKLWRGLKKTIFWSYERGSWPYDVMVILIVLFVLLTPARWFHDQPQNDAARDSGITLVAQDPAARTATYRIDPRLFPASAALQKTNPELERETHQILSGSVAEPFQIRSIEPVLAQNNSILYYQVEVKR
jgi:hypothetical protein